MTKAPDLEEAKELIRETAMARTRGTRCEANDKAAEALIGELLKLNASSGVEIKKVSEHNVDISFGGSTVHVTYERKVGVCVQHGKGKATSVKLDRDPGTGRFVGIEHDTFRTPIPGAPRSRRPAV